MAARNTDEAVNGPSSCFCTTITGDAVGSAELCYTEGWTTQLFTLTEQEGKTQTVLMKNKKKGVSLGSM